MAIGGEPGVGKSRLVFELTNSRQVDGWLVLEAGSVSYGKTVAYLPVVDLLKGYFGIDDRDTHLDIREKVTGKILALDRDLGTDHVGRFGAPRCSGRRSSMAGARARPSASADARWAQPSPTPRDPSPTGPASRRRSSLDRLGDPGVPRRPDRAVCPPPACSSSSPTAPNTAMSGATRRTTPRSASMRCRRRAWERYSIPSWVLTPQFAHSRASWLREPRATLYFSRRAFAPWWKRRP